MCRAANFHISALRHIRNVISNDTAETVAQALVSSRLDYANSILFGVSKQNIMQLQRAQILLTGYLLKQMIDFKICVLSFRTLIINSPAYLVTLLNSYKPARTLRSMNNNLVQFPRTRTVTGTRAFQCAAPQLWIVYRLILHRCTLWTVSAKNLKRFYIAKPMGIVWTSISICA